jgi:hypothetical protein
MRHFIYKLLGDAAEEMRPERNALLKVLLAKIDKLKEKKKCEQNHNTKL